MAAQLQLLFQLAGTPGSSSTSGSPTSAATESGHHHGHPHGESLEKLATMFSPKAAPNPQTTIIHYLWLTAFPATFTNGGTGSPFATGGGWFTLNVVYDLDFKTYVKNLVLADLKGFNDNLPLIKGTAPFLPLTQNNVDPFIDWVASQDLAQVVNPATGKPYSSPIAATYTWTVYQIYQNMGFSPGA